MTTAPPTDSPAEDSPANGGRTGAEVDCAAAHTNGAHWPAELPRAAFVGRTYNCLVFELGSEGVAAICADFCSMYGAGESAAAALADLREEAERRIEELGYGNCRGGVYPGTSPPRFQEASASFLERCWSEDGVAVLSRRRARLTLFAPVAADRD